LIYRVDSISLGTSSKGEISIEFSEDVYRASQAVLVLPDYTKWVNPIAEPVEALGQLVNTLPYYAIAKIQGDSYARSLTYESEVGIYGVIAAPSRDTLNAQAYYKSGNSWITLEGKAASKVFSCTLSADINQTSTVIPIENIIDTVLIGIGDFIEVGQEYMGLEAITSTTMTVKRGVMSSYPRVHSAGARVYGS
ncbi:MAG: hypothetical protein P1T08_18920, partial [Acidimicrobiia bacterium]|nr:hypothetical protein [Acidimicrobiia bacterium]